MSHSATRIWISGADGLLGKCFVGSLEKTDFSCFASDGETDITDCNSIALFGKAIQPDWIINCAAFTDVDRAETTHSSDAHSTNTLGAANMALLAAELNAKLIHFSTDYVFDGGKGAPYDECDLPNPLSVYGYSKLEGEKRIRQYYNRFFIFRVSRLYDLKGKGFPWKILEGLKNDRVLEIVDDLFGSPTCAETLCANVIRLIESDSSDFGLYHCCDEGRISWYDFAQKILKLAIKHRLPFNEERLIPVPAASRSDAAKRPPDSTLSTEKALKRLNFTIHPWDESLELIPVHFQHKEKHEID